MPVYFTTTTSRTQLGVLHVHCLKYTRAIWTQQSQSWWLRIRAWCHRTLWHQRHDRAVRISRKAPPSLTLRVTMVIWALLGHNNNKCCDGSMHSHVLSLECNYTKVRLLCLHHHTKHESNGWKTISLVVKSAWSAHRSHTSPYHSWIIGPVPIDF